MTSAPQKPLTYPFDYLAYLLARASTCISAEFHKELRRLGVPVSTWRIVSSISEETRSVSNLADIVLMQQPTLSKALDRLEAQGLVVRERHDDSRRKVYVKPTEKGRALAERLKPKATAHEQKVLKDMSGNDVRALKEQLRQLIRHYEHDDSR